MAVIVMHQQGDKSVRGVRRHLASSTAIPQVALGLLIPLLIGCDSAPAPVATPVAAVSSPASTPALGATHPGTASAPTVPQFSPTAIPVQQATATTVAAWSPMSSRHHCQHSRQTTRSKQFA